MDDTSIGDNADDAIEEVFGIKTLQFEPGDMVFLFTDGLIENQGPSGKLLRIKDVKKAILGQSEPEKIKNEVLLRGREVWLNQPPDDDCSFLVIQWQGKQSQAA